MIRQLAFDLPARETFRREDFFVSPANALALATLDGGDWPGGKLMLVGPAGSGKTHLARMWAAETAAPVVLADDLTSVDLHALAAGGRVVVEHAEAVAGNQQAEVALFHLHNLVCPLGRLLLTARAPVRDWGLALPDLHSRLTAAPVALLALPDDALLSAVLIKLFSDRQLAVPPALIPWLVARMDRSIGAARALVAALDARSLAERRAINQKLAADVLDKLSDG